MNKVQKLELTWVGKNEEFHIEPRILVENKELSNISNDENTENMLIHGDNLLALKAIEQKYTGQIKCIYIDPPYNANATGVPFDDNLEHSTYLSLMYPRIKLLYSLLSPYGVFCMQCDYNEMAYLKIICDEIFGRKNYVSMITVKTSSESGVKVNANKPAKVSEYILMYAKDKNLLIYKPIRIITGYDKNYSNYIENPNAPMQNWIIKNIKDVLANKLNKNKKDITEEELRTFQIENKDRIFSIRDISDSLKKYLKTNNIDRNSVYEYTTSTGKKTLLLKNGEVVFVKNKVAIIDGKEELTKIASDIWTDISWDGIANEGNVVLKNSKKPERLIKRILDAFTEKNDFVLDSFLGSGTTSAVAHKMGRKWIGIELGDYAYEMTKRRMDNVINGTDLTGITKSVNWQGGGGYRFYELAPTLIKEDAFGQPIINPEYNAEMLAAAVAKHEGYFYNPDSSVFWKQSNNKGNSYLFVTTNHVDSRIVETIKADMKEDEFVLIVCKSFDSNCNGYKNIAIKKIPQSLLKNCEFGVDNYNLNIINPPVYEEDEDE